MICGSNHIIYICTRCDHTLEFTMPCFLGSAMAEQQVSPASRRISTLLARVCQGPQSYQNLAGPLSFKQQVLYIECFTNANTVGLFGEPAASTFKRPKSRLSSTLHPRPPPNVVPNDGKEQCKSGHRKNSTKIKVQR